MTASREPQGLIVSLIIFVVLTVMLAVSTFSLHSRDEEAAAKVAAAQSRASEARSQADAARGKLDRIKRLLGFSEDTPTETIETKWRQDAMTYAKVYPQEEGELDYIKLVMYQASEIRGLDDNIRQLTASLTRRDERIVTLQKQHHGQMLTLAEQFTLLKNDLARRTRKFADQWSIYIASKDQLKSDFDASRATNDAELKRLREQLTGMNDRLLQAERLVRALKRKLQISIVNNREVPDGAITAVNQATGRVYLNVGRAEGLRPQVTFSVYGSDIANITSAKPKARLQVTRLLGDAHSAEARITESNIADPILRGDLIFSPVWSPGQKIHFAFVGRFDASADGNDDGMSRLRELVTIAGGAIDAHSDEDGGLRGRFTVDTRYLVVGNPPLDKPAAMQSYSDAIDLARAQHIEQISLEKFLDMTGWKKRRRSVPLGPGAKSPVESGDFKPRRPRW
ncbi:MAG: hypothetical protein IIA67_02150 [Planctomycetes bacterium]|nr:hypothetical protein [Planctomycetota bacterium]